MHRNAVDSILILACVTFVGVASATPCLAQAKAEGEQPWAPPPPNPTSLDWVMLVSGEWLAGEIKFLRDDRFELDSEELDLLKLDWSDVAELRSPRPLQYVFEDGRMVTGTAVMRGDTIRVRVGEQVNAFPRSQLVSIVAGAQSEWDHWSGKASVGLVGRAGNTEQSDINGLLFFRRESARTRFDTQYSVNWGKLNGVEAVNNQLLTSSFNVYLTRGLFLTPIGVEFYSDEFQNIDLRSTVGAGVGYDIVDWSKLNWYVQLGAGYVDTRYTSVEAGTSDAENSATVIPSTSMEWDPTGDIETSLDYNATITVPEVRNTFHHLVGLIDIDVYGVLDFTVSVTWDRNENPRAREDGTVPRRDDFRIAFGLGVDF